MPTNTDQAVFRDKHAAQYLDMSRSTFRAYVKAGKIPQPLKPSQGVSLWRVNQRRNLNRCQRPILNSFRGGESGAVCSGRSRSRSR
mgnify:CR=1 FL=1